MSELVLTEGLFLHPTPGGAYSAVSSAEENSSRTLLRNLLGQQQTPILTPEVLVKLSGSESEDEALELLKHLQSLSWIEGLDSSKAVLDSPLEEVLPRLLEALSSSGKALLGDEQGFYLASSGFPHEVAEELSALSAELASLHARRSGLLVNNLGLASSAWSVVDAAGHSKIGFWPLYIGKQRFVLVMEGIPYLNRPGFIELIWLLSRRYASSLVEL
jgi:hypothetical protein